MPDWSEIAAQISTTLSILKQTSGLVKDVAPMVKDAESQEKLAKVREQLLDASERINDLRAINNAIVDRNLELESEIRKVKSFLAKRDEYVPHKLGRGAFVYLAKDQADKPEDAPWYCQHCFEVEHKLSPMNFEKDVERRMVRYGCRGCGATIQDYPRDY